MPLLYKLEFQTSHYNILHGSTFNYPLRNQPSSYPLYLFLGFLKELARLKSLETFADLRQSPGVLVPLGWKLQRVGEQKTPLYAISRDMNT